MPALATPRVTFNTFAGNLKGFLCDAGWNLAAGTQKLPDGLTNQGDWNFRMIRKLRPMTRDEVRDASTGVGTTRRNDPPDLGRRECQRTHWNVSADPDIELVVPES